MTCAPHRSTAQRSTACWLSRCSEWRVMASAKESLASNRRQGGAAWGAAKASSRRSQAPLVPACEEDATSSNPTRSLPLGPSYHPPTLPFSPQLYHRGSQLTTLSLPGYQQRERKERWVSMMRMSTPSATAAARAVRLPPQRVRSAAAAAGGRGRGRGTCVGSWQCPLWFMRCQLRSAKRVMPFSGAPSPLLLSPAAWRPLQVLASTSSCQQRFGSKCSQRSTPQHSHRPRTAPFSPRALPPAAPPRRHPPAPAAQRSVTVGALHCGPCVPCLRQQQSPG